jgi:hypothetical protein
VGAKAYASPHDVWECWHALNTVASIGVVGVAERTGISIELVEEVLVDWAGRRLVKVEQFAWSKTPAPRYRAVKCSRWDALGDNLRRQRWDHRAVLLGNLLASTRVKPVEQVR